MEIVQLPCKGRPTCGQQHPHRCGDSEGGLPKTGALYFYTPNEGVEIGEETEGIGEETEGIGGERKRSV
jgi:hypothetical protein